MLYSSLSIPTLRPPEGRPKVEEDKVREGETERGWDGDDILGEVGEVGDGGDGVFLM